MNYSIISLLREFPALQLISVKVNLLALVLWTTPLIYFPLQFPLPWVIALGDDFQAVLQCGEHTGRGGPKRNGFPLRINILFLVRSPPLTLLYFTLKSMHLRPSPKSKGWALFLFSSEQASKYRCSVSICPNRMSLKVSNSPTFSRRLRCVFFRLPPLVNEMVFDCRLMVLPCRRSEVVSVLPVSSLYSCSTSTQCMRSSLVSARRHQLLRLLTTTSKRSSSDSWAWEGVVRHRNKVYTQVGLIIGN